MSKIIILILFILQLTSSIPKKDQEKHPNALIALGNKQGYNFRNIKDDFYYDICKIFTSGTKKDVTLEYRRKYYYFPESKLNNNAQDTKRNLKGNDEFPSIKIKDNPKLCFSNWEQNFKNPHFYLLFILICIQLVLLEFLIVYYHNEIWKKSPLELLLKLKDIKLPKDKKEYFKHFLILTTDTSNKNTKLPETSSNENLQKNIDDIKNFTQLVDEEDIKNDNNSAANMNVTENNNINYQNNNLIIDNNEENKKNNDTQKSNLKNIPDNTGKFDDIKNQINMDEMIKGNVNIQPNNQIKLDDDNYTFGGGVFNKKFLNFTTKNTDKSNNTDNNNINNINNNIINDEINPQESVKSLSGDKILNNEKEQVENYIYKKINHNKYIEFLPYANPKQLEFLFTKEELFYNGYNFAVLEDKRSIFEIYRDILSYCQIWFIFNEKVKIFEDVRAIILYYCTKIELHLLINAKLMNNIEINKIYDDEFGLINYCYHFFISSLISTMIGELLFFLTNSKRLFIKQKNQIDSLRLFDVNKKNKLVQITSNLVTDGLFHKLLYFTLFAFIIIVQTFKDTISFTSTFKNSRNYYYMCVVGSIIFSQLSPFTLAFIPAFLRKKTIESKSYFKYKILSIIELLYLP